MKRILLLFIVSLGIQGCSSLEMHKKIESSQPREYGHPYAGFQNSLTTFPCNLAMSGSVLLMNIPFIILDIPLSLLADTFYLPWDANSETNYTRDEVTYSVSEYCDKIDPSKIHNNTLKLKTQ